MKAPAICEELLNPDSTLSKKIPLVIHRFPEHHCVLGEKPVEDGYILLMLMFSRFCKGTITAMGTVIDKHNKVVAKTADARIVRILTKRFGFYIDGVEGIEWVLRRNK